MVKNIKFISEVCSNHNSKLSRALEFIDKSSDIGCYSVKFQMFKISKLFSNEILKKSKIHRQRIKWELDNKYIEKIASRCEQRKIKFSCTPFYLEAVDLLKDYVSFFKIASYELLWDDLLKKCAQTKKPIIISTGMSSYKEIKTAYRKLKNFGCNDISVMHCVSNYPANPLNCNLSTIKKIRSDLKCKVGWSDHSKDTDVLLRSILKWNSDIIEFHMDLDGKGVEYNFGHCWLPHEISPLIRLLNGPHIYDGRPKIHATKSELNEQKWRRDPIDGFRPLISTRKKFLKNLK
jgi:sialic acid synthase SpsE